MLHHGALVSQGGLHSLTPWPLLLLSPPHSESTYSSPWSPLPSAHRNLTLPTAYPSSRLLLLDSMHNSPLTPKWMTIPMSIYDGQEVHCHSCDIPDTFTYTIGYSTFYTWLLSCYWPTSSGHCDNETSPYLFALQRKRFLCKPILLMKLFRLLFHVHKHIVRYVHWLPSSTGTELCQWLVDVNANKYTWLAWHITQSKGESIYKRPPKWIQ